MNISAHTFKNFLESKKDATDVDFINVCTPAEYKESHIEGVRNLPLDEIADNIDALSKKKTVYIHCRSGNRGQKAIDQLKKAGVKAELINLQGGLNAWEQAHLPTNSLTTRLPIIRQVLITAGLLIILGFVLAQVAHASFIYIALIVGLGLLFSGISGWCGMASILSKMPWNK